MAIEFSIDDRRLDDDTHVIAVAGEVDLFTAPEFKERVMAPIAAGVERVVVDLARHRDHVGVVVEPAVVDGELDRHR